MPATAARARYRARRTRTVGSHVDGHGNGDGHAERVTIHGDADGGDAQDLADRVSAMLTKLIRSV